MPTAYVLYNTAVVKEDRAPLGSDPSALAIPHGIGRHLYPVPSFPDKSGCRRLQCDKSLPQGGRFYQLFWS
jgi:hypothetical protein